MWRSNYYSPYESAADREATAKKRIKKLRQQGYELAPVEAFSGNKIAKTFWGQSWCRHLESFSDYENRLPRGRSYLRNGSVCHLAIAPGRVEAFVSGSELYEIDIKISPLPAAKWSKLKQRCSGKIGSLIELLQGKLSSEVMTIVTDQADGLFPAPKEIRLSCTCPDHAGLCKHLAATLYGIGARLDAQPELLFTLRGLDQNELIETNLAAALDTPPTSPASSRRRLAPANLSDVFGIEIDTAPLPAAPPPPVGASSLAIPKPPAKKSPPSKTPKAPAPKPGPRTGADLQKLRRRLGLTDWEFSLVAEVTSATVRNWEAKGKAPLNAQPANQQKLDALAQLTPLSAQDLLATYP